MMHEVTTISDVCFYSSGLIMSIQTKMPVKRHSKFELSGDHIGIFPVFKASGKILKIGLAV